MHFGRGELKEGVLLSYVLVFISVFNGLVFTPFMIRCMGNDQFGLYELIGSLAGYMAILNLGLGTTIVKYVSICVVENDKKKEASILAVVMRVYLVVSLIVVIIGAILYFNLDRIFSKSLTAQEIRQARLMLIISILNIAVSIPGGLFNSYISAYQRYVFARGIVIVQNIFKMLIVSFGILLGGDATSVVLIDFIVSVLNITANIFYCVKVMRIEIKLYSVDKSWLKEIIFFSVWVFLNKIIDQINWRVDKTILGIRLSTSAVAIYSVGTKISNLFLQLSTAVSGVFLPKVTRMAASGASNEMMMEFMVYVGRIQGMILLCVYTPFLILGDSFVLLWLGSGYEESWLCAVFIMSGLLIPLMQNVGLTYLQVKNKLYIVDLSYLVASILNIMMTWKLIEVWGVSGAAFASMVTYILGSVIFLNIYYHIGLKLNMLKFLKEIASVFFVPGCIFIVYRIVILKICSIETWCSLVAHCSIYVISYCLLTWMFIMNEDEKRTVYTILHIKKGKDNVNQEKDQINH